MAKQQKQKQKQRKNEGGPLTLYADASTPGGAIALIANEYGAKCADVSAKRLISASKSPAQLRIAEKKTGKTFFLDMPLSVASYLCSSNEVFSGKNDLKSQSQIVQWAEFARGEAHHAMCAYFLNQKSKADDAVKKILKMLDDVLKCRTFLVGHRVSLADAAVLPEVLPLVREGRLCDRSKFPHLVRWANTCISQQQFAKVLGEPKLIQ